MVILEIIVYLVVIAMLLEQLLVYRALMVDVFVNQDILDLIVPNV